MVAASMERLLLPVAVRVHRELLRCAVQQARGDVPDVSVLAQARVKIRARRLTLTDQHVVEEHTVPTERHRMAYNRAITDDTERDSCRHERKALAPMERCSAGVRLFLTTTEHK